MRKIDKEIEQRLGRIAETRNASASAACERRISKLKRQLDENKGKPAQTREELLASRRQSHP